MFKDYNSEYPNEISLGSNNDTAIINAVDDSKISYTELHKRAESIHTTLTSKGFNRKNRIIVSSKFSNINTIPTLVGIVNVSSAVPVSSVQTQEEIEFIIHHGNVCLVICEKDEEQFIKAAEKCNVPWITFDNIDSAEFKNIEACEETEGMGCCASGTSQNKRLIPIPRTRMHYWAFNSFRMFARKTKSFVIIPLMNSGGFSHMISTLMNGGTVIIPESYDPSDLEYAYNKYKPNHIHGAPISYTNLLKINSTNNNLKHCRITGSKAKENLIEQIFENLKPKTINSVYGTNENGPAFVNIMTKDSINESIGIPDDGYEYMIDKQQHIHIRGGTGHTKFFDTGDLAEERDGKIYLIGRSDDVIVTDPHSVNPDEVEEILLKHEKIDEIVVFGKPLESTSSKVCCIYVGDINEEVLVSYAHETLATYKVPKECIKVESIPLNANGKVSRKQLQKLF